MKTAGIKTLLLVEDEVLIAMSKQQELNGYNYNVIHANTAEKAIKIAIENKDIDLILMDIDLGSGIDGTMVAELILKEKEIPVMFMSSHTEPEIVEKTEKITSYGYVVKSSTITVLDASIKMAFKLFEAHKDLHENEIKHNAMMLNISDVISIIDKNGKINFKSGNPKKHFGWEFGDLEGSDYQKIIHPDDLERVNILFSKLLETDKSTITIEFKFKCKDNSYKPVELTATNLLKDSNIKGTLVNFHDISERIQSDKDLLSYQQKLALHIEQTPLAVIDWDSEFKVESWNKSAEKIFGFSSNEALGRHDSELIVPENAKEQVNEVWTKLALKKGGTRNSNENITKEGKSILCEWYNTAIVNNEGNVIGVSSLVKNITEQKLIEEKLLESENRFKSIAENMADWIWEIDSDGYYTFCSDKVETIMGYSPIEIIGKTPFTFMCPEEKENIKKIVENTIQKRQPFNNLENWNFTKDGRRICLQTSGAPFFNKNGNFSGYRGVDSDITDLKFIEQKLKNSEEQYRRVVEETESLITQVDMNGSIIFINNVSKDIFGIEKDKCIGLSALDFIHTEDQKRSKNWMKECIDQHVNQATIENRQVNRETSDVTDILWTSRFYYTNKGSLKVIDSIGQNITNRKSSEKRIENLLLEKEILLKEVHHRIKNNMTIISNLLSMHSNIIKIPEASQVLQVAVARIESMGVLYDKLYRSESYDEVSSREYLFQLIREISKLFSNATKIEIKKQIDDFKIDSKIIFPLGIIVNELLTNTMKYAFTDRKSGIIIITVEENSGNVTLSIQDNGNGLPENFDIIENNGFGLMLVKMLSEQLNGEFTIRTDRGTISTLKFSIT